MKNKKLTTYQMAVTALMAAALCVLGPLSVPIGAIPISLSNFVICLTAWLLGPKFGTLSVAVYLLIGLVGVPVFSGYGAGIAKLAGPTGGYLVAYPLMALVLSLVCQHFKGFVPRLVGVILAVAVCYTFGTAWFMFMSGNDLATSLAWCVTPFVIPDLIKGVCALLLAKALESRLNKAAA